MLLGLDIGGTKCAVILGKDKKDTIDIIAKRVVPTNKSVYEMIDLLFETAEELLAKESVSKQKRALFLKRKYCKRQQIILNETIIIDIRNAAK